MPQLWKAARPAGPAGNVDRHSPVHGAGGNRGRTEAGRRTSAGT
jgi:hypothetical protein